MLPKTSKMQRSCVVHISFTVKGELVTHIAFRNASTVPDMPYPRAFAHMISSAWNSLGPQSL